VEQTNKQTNKRRNKKEQTCRSDGRKSSNQKCIPHTACVGYRC